MTNPRIPVTEDELHAYIDNELPAERRGDVEAWLSTHPDDGERVRSWREMAEALHARYDSVADEPVPQRLSIDRLVRTPEEVVQSLFHDPREPRPKTPVPIPATNRYGRC
jgi:anti-sigma factor RsiW